MGKNLDKFTNT